MSGQLPRGLSPAYPLLGGQFPTLPRNQNAAKPADERASSVLIVRCHPLEKARWVKAALARKLKLSQWVTEVLNSRSGQ